MKKFLRRNFKHAVVAITAGAFLFSSLSLSLFLPHHVLAVEGAGTGTEVPLAPINLSANLVDGTPQKITLTWQLSSPGEISYNPTRYIIYRVTGASPNFSGASPYAYVDFPTATYDDTSVSPGNTYNYKVSSQRVVVDGSGFPTIKGESTNSNLASVTIPISSPTNPSPVITANLNNDNTSALVSWSALSGATGYTSYRKAPGANTFSLVGTYGSGTTNFTDTGLVVNSGTYTYKITASFSSGSDTESNQASVTPVSSPTPPSGGGGGGGTYTPPLSLIISATASSSSEIDVTWPFVPDALYYYVYSGKSPTSLTKVGDGARNNVNVHFEHVNLTPATTYYYKVEAYSSTGLLVTSNIANATTLALPTPGVTTTPPVITPTTTPSPSVVECGSQDWSSPVRITDPNSGVKFTKLPDRAIFHPGEAPAFIYCFRNITSQTLQVKVLRTFFNTKTKQEYSAGETTFNLAPAGDSAKGDRFSLSRTQPLDKNIPLGEYRVRVQIISISTISVGDEVLAAAPNQLDENSFIFLVDNYTPPPQTIPPTEEVPPPPLLKPMDPTSNIKFTNLPKQNTFWAGQALRVAVGYRNTSGENQLLTLQCDLLDQDGNLLDRQEANLPTLKARQQFKFTTGKGCRLPGSQPLSILLPTGYYTFRVQLLDQNTQELVDTNSFNFRVVKRR